MKARPDCIPCVVEQALKVAKAVSTDDWLQRKVLNEGMGLIAGLDFNSPPTAILFSVIRQATKTLGSQDPFEEDKLLFNKEAQALEGELRKLIDASDNPLRTAAMVAASGAVVDMSTPEPVDIEKAAVEAAGGDFAIDDFDDFTEDLGRARNVVYLLGNAGEAALDKLFIERLENKDVTCVAKKVPILLQATVKDARDAGLEDVSKIIDPGADLLGTSAELVTKEFKEVLGDADLIVAKGQYNYDTLYGTQLPPAYFAFRPVCVCMAKHLGIEMHKNVFIKNTGEQ